MVTEVYDIDPKHAGLVIGKKGAGIRDLRQMPGIINVDFNTSHHSVHKLTVMASNKDACQKVYTEIQKRIGALVPAVPHVMKNLIVSNDPNWQAVVLQPCSSNIAVVIGERNSRNNDVSEKFIVSTFKSRGQSKSFDMSSFHGALGDTKASNFMEIDDKNAIKLAFDKALQNQKSIEDKTLVFTLSPGKLIFLGKGYTSSAELNRNGLLQRGDDYLKNQGIRTFFVPNLQPNYFRYLTEKLQSLGFENFEKTPDSYTVVHLDVKKGNKNVHYSVRLAVDSELNCYARSSDDPRLSQERKEAVDKILSCKTIGDVFPGVKKEKLKINYFMQTKFLHPDENFHEGAADAFKILNDAYEQLGKDASPTKPVLAVEAHSKRSTNSKNALPPKVIKVRTDKIRLCTLTTVSEKNLDVRATLVGFEEDKENLSEEVKDILNRCWDQRDAYGNLPMTTGTLNIQSIKQATEVHNWYKEIQIENQTQMMRVKVKKLRQKAKLEVNWLPAIEIDLKIERDPNYKFDAQQLSDEFYELVRWANKMM